VEAEGLQYWRTERLSCPGGRYPRKPFLMGPPLEDLEEFEELELEEVVPLELPLFVDLEFDILVEVLL
jgi:hypothetical protein